MEDFKVNKDKENTPEEVDFFNDAEPDIMLKKKIVYNIKSEKRKKLLSFISKAAAIIIILSVPAVMVLNRHDGIKKQGLIKPEKVNSIAHNSTLKSKAENKSTERSASKTNVQSKENKKSNNNKSLAIANSSANKDVAAVTPNAHASSSRPTNNNVKKSTKPQKNSNSKSNEVISSKEVAINNGSVKDREIAAQKTENDSKTNDVEQSVSSNFAIANSNIVNSSNGTNQGSASVQPNYKAGEENNEEPVTSGEETEGAISQKNAVDPSVEGQQGTGQAGDGLKIMTADGTNPADVKENCVEVRFISLKSLSDIEEILKNAGISDFDLDETFVAIYLENEGYNALKTYLQQNYKDEVTITEDGAYAGKNKICVKIYFN